MKPHQRTFHIIARCRVRESTKQQTLEATVIMTFGITLEGFRAEKKNDVEQRGEGSKHALQ